MKVLMIIPELVTGGAQRSFTQLALDLSHHYEVEVVVFQSSQTKYELSIPIHSLHVNGGKSYPEKAYRFLQRVIRLRKLKRKLGPTVSISFLEGADYVNILSSVGERVIISIRGSKEHDKEIRGGLGWLRRRILIPFLYERASCIVAVSKSLEQEMIEIYNLPPAKLCTIYNYYDLEKLNQKVKEPLPSQFSHWITGKLIITVGRLHPAKNQEFLINIFPSILSQCPNAKLLVVGDGKLKDALINAARATGVRVFSAWQDEFTSEFDIYFMGEHINPFPFLSRSNLFVLASLYEGFPNVLIEAMISRLPVVAADCNYGPKEILHGTDGEKYGLLLPAEFEQAKQKELWTGEIVQLLKDEKQLARYSEDGLKRVATFARDRILKSWIQTIGADKLAD